MSANLRHLFLIALIALLSACATNIKVTGDIPRPLIEPLPITVELVYTDEFRRYTYEEEEKGRGLRSIAFGQAQMDLFDAIFGYTTQTSGDAQSAGETLVSEKSDIRITPTLLDFQYSAPRETKLNLYEIWLKYRIKIEDSDNREIADWEVKGYGKTPTAMLSSAASAFDSATNVALRDVGAQMSIGFRTQPEIVDFIERRNKESLPRSETSQDDEVLSEISLDAEALD